MQPDESAHVVCTSWGYVKCEGLVWPLAAAILTPEGAAGSVEFPFALVRPEAVAKRSSFQKFEGVRTQRSAVRPDGYAGWSSDAP